MDKKNTTADKILEVLDDVKRHGNLEENLRVKAIVKTKLQEAYLWAGKIYNKDF